MKLSFLSRTSFIDRFGSSVKSRTFQDVVKELRALLLQTPNSPYDPTLFPKPQSLYSLDNRGTRFCRTSVPSEGATLKLHYYLANMYTFVSLICNRALVISALYYYLSYNSHVMLIRCYLHLLLKNTLQPEDLRTDSVINILVVYLVSCNSFYH